MRKKIISVGISALALAFTFSLTTPAVSKAQENKNDYIVKFVDGSNLDEEVASLKSQGHSFSKLYRFAFKGGVLKLTDAQALALSKNPRIELLEKDGPVSIDATQNSATWGLDRIDQRSLPLNSTYNYNTSASNVTAYVIDTGILPTHTDFGGRVASGFTAITDGNGTVDCNGHGTHVSGTIGGSTYGVAKGVSLVPVRVLDCTGSGSFQGVIDGINWVISNKKLPAVANMSLGGGYSSTVNAAVASLVNANVTVAVAAGNSNTDACKTSPASEPSALTVGATTSGDARASYSNYGKCLDVFAPGSSITSDWYTSTSATNTISGTSMASPHVAGVAALYLANNSSATSQQVANWIKSNATVGVVTSAGSGSPNSLLATDTAIAQVVTTVPSTPVVNSLSSPSKGTLNASWSVTSDGGSPITGYKVTLWIQSGSLLKKVQTATVAITSNSFTNLKSGRYTVSVIAQNSVGSSLESSRPATVLVG